MAGRRDATILRKIDGDRLDFEFWPEREVFGRS